MAFLFGGGKALGAAKANPIKDYQRELRHAQRSMDREELKAAAQERALVADILRQAKERKLTSARPAPGSSYDSERTVPACPP